MKWNYEALTFWSTLGIILAGIVSFVYGPVVMSQVQAEQIKTIQTDVTDLKTELPAIAKSLSRIEGKLGIGN